jgi:hypothetical protein
MLANIVKSYDKVHEEEILKTMSDMLSDGMSNSFQIQFQ